MPIEDHALPWWLGPSKAPWEAMLAGSHAGSEIAANNIHRQQVFQAGAQLAQQAQRDDTAVKLKLIDLGLESDRNDLALKAFNLKETTQLNQKTAMLDIGQYVADATENEMLTDPSTQAGFHRLTAKYAPYINEQTVNSIWDNTFQEAQRREDRANGKGADTTAGIKNFAKLQTLRDAVYNAPDEESKAKAQESLGYFERLVRAEEAPTGPPTLGMDFGVSTDPSGREVLWHRGAKGALVTRLVPAGLDKMNAMEYASQLRTLEQKEKLSNFDVSEKLDPKESDAVTANRQRKFLHDHYEALAKKPTPNQPSANSPSWDDYLKFKETK